MTVYINLDIIGKKKMKEDSIILHRTKVIKKVFVVLAEVFKMETFLSRVLKSLSYEDVCVT